jgi:acyl-CoA synthetase (NDP forming)
MALSQQHNKPVAYYLSAAAQEITYLKQHYDFPVFTAVVETMRALQISHRHCCQSQQVHEAEPAPALAANPAAVRRLVDAARSEGRNLLLSEALEALEQYGIPTVRGRFARNAQDAKAAADEIGYPVALKIISEEISHKSDVGGVQLNLRNAEALAAAFDEMYRRIHGLYPQAKLDGVLVQPMVSGGHELILGGRQDPQFGPVVLAGLGGIFVEIIGEAAMRVAPITEDEARQMLEELRGIQVLKGARGHGPSDVESLVQALMRLSQLMVDFPEIKELDINPLRVFAAGEGCRALDARVLIG